MAVLITGANRGIGRALYDGYAAAGADVIGTCRGAPPGAGRWIRLDVAAPDAGATLRAALGDTPLDLLICNAGVNLGKGETLDNGFAPDLWARTFAVNVTGVFTTIQAALPGLRAARGKIAIISSQMGSSQIASGGGDIYRASKAAALNLGRNLAVDLKSDGIAVGIYHPGWVQTDMGGASAEITMQASADGLMRRFAALDTATTGCFETWDGRAHPF